MEGWCHALLIVIVEGETSSAEMHISCWCHKCKMRGVFQARTRVSFMLFLVIRRNGISTLYHSSYHFFSYSYICSRITELSNYDCTTQNVSTRGRWRFVVDQLIMFVTHDALTINNLSDKDFSIFDGRNIFI